MLILQGIPFGTFALVLVGYFPNSTKTVFLLMFWSLLRGLWVLIEHFFTCSWLGSSIVKVIQQLKNQMQHSKPLLKIAEKPDTFFAMALFYMSDTVLY